MDWNISISLLTGRLLFELEIKYFMPEKELLIAIINNKSDFNIIKKNGWYRIPVISANKWLEKCWPPQWLAFYQTKVFGAEAFSVNYYAKVIDIRIVGRQELFPGEPPNKKSGRQYYQIFLEPLQKLPKPIISKRLRRIVFIPTTWNRFINATEINDLFDNSPLEDHLWTMLKQYSIPAERQEYISVKKKFYALDFSIYCSKGDLNIETDGDNWHANHKQAFKDNIRDNALVSRGWSVLRFTTRQIKEQSEKYCIPVITDTIGTLGGIKQVLKTTD